MLSAGGRTWFPLLCEPAVRLRLLNKRSTLAVLGGSPGTNSRWLITRTCLPDPFWDSQHVERRLFCKCGIHSWPFNYYFYSMVVLCQNGFHICKIISSQHAVNLRMDQGGKSFPPTVAYYQDLPPWSIPRFTECWEEIERDYFANVEPIWDHSNIT